MKNPVALWAATLLCLGILALCLAPQAFHRGNLGLFIVLLVVAVIFSKRLQKRS
jgi:hypothetical protein